VVLATTNTLQQGTQTSDTFWVEGNAERKNASSLWKTQIFGGAWRGPVGGAWHRGSAGRSRWSAVVGTRQGAAVIARRGEAEHGVAARRTRIPRRLSPRLRQRSGRAAVVHDGMRGEAAMAAVAGLDPGPDMAAAVACWVREWGKKARGGAMRLGSVWLLEGAEI
jgi:hypothetical protein